MKSGNGKRVANIAARAAFQSPPLRVCQTPPCRTRFRAVELADKILAPDQLHTWRDSLRAESRSLVVTNGCFDILHAGHVTYLAAAKCEGDVLLVGLNGDASVRALKGEGRPINSEQDRAVVLAGLASVDAVAIFTERDAMRLLEEVQPDIYVKGGDYNIDTINQDERRLIERQGGKVVILPGVEGRSTSAVIERMK